MFFSMFIKCGDGSSLNPFRGFHRFRIRADIVVLPYRTRMLRPGRVESRHRIRNGF